MNQFFSINWFGSMNWAMSMNCFFLMNWPLSAQDLEPNIELRHERMGRTEDVRVRYLQDLCRLWPPAKKVMEAKKLPAPQLHEKGRLMADLDRANIVKPEVPPSTRYPPDRKPPSKKKRSDANQLEEDKAWYLAGAVHPEFGRLRSAKLSDKVAVSYWNRFCLFVAFVDTTFAVFGSAWDYLSAEHVEAYFSHLGCGVPKKGGRLEPASSGWLDTVKRTFNSMAGCFVWPHMDDQQWAVYSDRTLQANVLALNAAQTMARQKMRGDIFVPDHHRQFGCTSKPGVSMNS
jgi:hypothetical protein